ncbi:hypothetical protein STENM327S_01480 [Streptomyces tendae]
MSIVYDRTKTVVRRHVAPGEAVPLHPEAVAFAGHYDFDIDVLAAYRPQGKGRGRAAGRHRPRPRPRRAGLCLGRGAERGLHRLGALAESEGPRHPRRGHRTPAVRDHTALRPLPQTPYVVTQRHLRHVGKDCLVAFDANLYSVPARKVRPRQLVEILSHEDAGQPACHGPRRGRPDAAGGPSASGRPRSAGRGRDALGRAAHRRRPSCHDRRRSAFAPPRPVLGPEAGPLQTLLNRTAAASVEVGRRPLSVYDELTGTVLHRKLPLQGSPLSELTSTRIRTTAAKLGLPHLAEAGLSRPGVVHAAGDRPRRTALPTGAGGQPGPPRHRDQRSWPIALEQLPPPRRP